MIYLQRFLLFLSLGLLLSGCGQSGKLYLPEGQHTVKQTGNNT